jgi:hypothetical protein
MPASPKNKHDLEAMLNAKAWKDPKFKKKLLEDPKVALKEAGFDMSKEVKIRVVEDDKDTVTFVLREGPSNLAELDEEEIQKIVGGASYDKTHPKIHVNVSTRTIC